MADKPAEFVPIGDHPADNFIQQMLEKKKPGLMDQSIAEMEQLRQEGVDTQQIGNPLNLMLGGMHQAFAEQTGSDMPYTEFVTKFRDKVEAAMKKHGVKPFSVIVGKPKVIGPAANPVLRTASDIVKSLVVSPLVDPVVGAMRIAGSPLADLPENQDPAVREMVRRGLMPAQSDSERRKGQVEVLTGLLNTGAIGEGMIAHAVNTLGIAGVLKNTVIGAAWGGMFGAATGAGQEEAAAQILEDAKANAAAGAVLGGGLTIAGKAVGAGLSRARSYKLDKLLADIDAQRVQTAAHTAEMGIPDALQELMPQSGLAPSVARMARDIQGAVVHARPYEASPELKGLPSNTQRFTNIDLPDNVRNTLDADKVVYLNRADSILREKRIRLNYETGEMTAVPQQGDGIAPPAIPESTTARLRAQAPVNVLPGGTHTIYLPAGMAQDFEKEMGYRLTYGDKIIADKAAEYDMLAPEVKAKIDYWTYVDKTEGTPAAQFMRNLEKSAKTRMNVRASKRLRTTFDITAAVGEGGAELTDAAIVGAAKLYRLGHLAPVTASKIWNNEMLQVLGDTPATRAALYGVYQKSQGQLNKMLVNMAPEMHDVRALMEKYQQGKAGQDWYTNGFAELKKMFGEEDAVLMAHLLSIHSTGTVVDQNVRGALQDFALLKSGQRPRGGRFPNNQIPMIEKMLKGQPYGDQKVQNFTHLLLGGTGHAVNDVQVARSLGWARESFSKNQYRFVDEVIRGLAKDAGVTPEQYQASLWATPRIAKAQEAFASGNKKALQYVGSFRTYPEAIRVENAKKGITNTLVTPADEGGGGYTFDPGSMGTWKGKGYLTTLTGEVVPEAKLTPGAILNFVNKIRPLMKQYQKEGVQFTVGLWKKGDGTVSVDLNLVTPDKEKALAIGRRTDQFAIGDMTTGNYEGDVPTGKAPESSQRKVAIPEVKRILKELLGGKL